MPDIPFGKQTHAGNRLLDVRDLAAYWPQFAIESIASQCPVALACNLASLCVLDLKAASWSKSKIISILTQNGEQTVASSIICPFHADRNSKRREYVLDLSPTGKWLVIGNDSDHYDHAKKMVNTTDLYLYDVSRHQWHSKLFSFKGIIDEVNFLSEELLVMVVNEFNKPRRRVYLHVSSGKVVDEVKDMYSLPLSIAPATGGSKLSYVKYDSLGDESHTLTHTTIDGTGNKTNEYDVRLPFKVDTFAACQGNQVFYQSFKSADIPSWVETKLPKGKIQDFIKGLYERDHRTVYDFASKQLVQSWKSNWTGSVSGDGSYLVIKEDDTDHHVTHICVYRLPLPVYSPWWSRGLSWSLMILLLLLVVRWTKPLPVTAMQTG